MTPDAVTTFIQPKEGVSPQKGIEPLNFDLKMNLAAAEEDVAKKREAYNNIFESISGVLNASEYSMLFKLLEAYASSTCYNQKFNDNEQEGFFRSAKLMELSLCLQLKYLNLNLNEHPLDWTAFKSLDALSDALLQLPIEHIYPFSMQLYQIDMDSIHQKAHAERITDIFKNSLIRLSYSFQKIILNCRDNYLSCKYSQDFYALRNKLIEKFIQNNPEEKRDFDYNRDAFMKEMKLPNEK